MDFPATRVIDRMNLGIPLPGFLDQANLYGFRPFAPLTDIDHDLLALGETDQTRSFQHRDMHENVLLPVGQGDEAAALVGIEPLDDA